MQDELFPLERPKVLTLLRDLFAQLGGNVPIRVLAEGVTQTAFAQISRPASATGIEKTGQGNPEAGIMSHSSGLSCPF